MSETPGTVNGVRLRTWLREWWVTLRYGSRLTSAGRTLRRNMRDDMSEYVEVDPPYTCECCKPRVYPPATTNPTGGAK